MPYTIAHRGVPIGRVEQNVPDELTAVVVLPLGGYDALRPAIRRASAALANLTFIRPAATAGSDSGGQGALAWAAALGRALELRDDHGAFVPTDFIELVDEAGDDGTVAAFVRRRHAHAAVTARRLLDRGSDRDRTHPGA